MNLLNMKKAIMIPTQFCKAILSLVASMLIVSCLLTGNAYAYIDPGSAILGLQAVIAAIVSGILWIGQPIKRLKGWIKRKNKKDA